jgi:hypothetical protein
MRAAVCCQSTARVPMVGTGCLETQQPLARAVHDRHKCEAEVLTVKSADVAMRAGRHGPCAPPADAETAWLSNGQEWRRDFQ